VTSGSSNAANRCDSGGASAGRAARPGARDRRSASSKAYTALGLRQARGVEATGEGRRAQEFSVGWCSAAVCRN